MVRIQQRQALRTARLTEEVQFMGECTAAAQRWIGLQNPGHRRRKQTEAGDRLGCGEQPESGVPRNNFAEPNGGECDHGNVEPLGEISLLRRPIGVDESVLQVRQVQEGPSHDGQRGPRRNDRSHCRGCGEGGGPSPHRS